MLAGAAAAQELLLGKGRPAVRWRRRKVVRQLTIEACRRGLLWYDVWSLCAHWGVDVGARRKCTNEFGYPLYIND